MIKRGMNNKSQAAVITVVLIILIVIVSIVIIANVIIPMVRQAGGEVGTEMFTVQLEIKETKLWITGGAKVAVRRGSGSGDISEIKFIFEDENGETHIVSRTDNLPDELETKVFEFIPGEIESDKKIQKISIAPVFGTKPGLEISETNIKKQDGERVYDAPEELVGWWKFDKDAKDSAGDNHGTFEADAHIANKVLVLDGIDDYVNIPDSPELRLGPQNSISIWINVASDASSWVRIVGKGNPSGRRNYGLWRENDGDLLWQVRDPVEGLCNYMANGGPGSDMNIAAGSGWRHIVATYDVPVGKVYVDNLEVFSFSNPRICDPLIQNSDPLIIGFNIGYFNGSIDEVMIFNRVLTEDEIYSIYINQEK